MIYNHPVGGLGNMFFQLAALWSLAKDNEDELCLINLDEILDVLINNKINTIRHAEVFWYFFNRFPNEKTTIKDVIVHPFVYTELKYLEGHQYVGYFQCEKYFKHRREEILKLLGPADEFNNVINNYSHLFGNISLHVRRGNYVSMPAFNIIHMDYYQRAIELLPKDLKIIVFSNDLNWCRQNFKGDRFVFIDEIDYITIYLMSKMKHHIIPNSTFSWWGAWMSEHDDGIKIAPKLWFGNNFEDGSDIVPDNWIKI